MKAFKIEVPGEYGEDDVVAIAVAETASKARYMLLLHCQEFGFKNAATGKPWPQMQDLRVTRAPEFDVLVKSNKRPLHWSLRYAQYELEAVAAL